MPIKKFAAPAFILAAVLTAAFSSSDGQRACGSQYLTDYLATKDAATQAQYAAKRTAMLGQAQSATGTAAKTTAQFPIPVIFHVILTPYQFNRIGGIAGIALRADSQIRVINRDFTKSNLDLGLVPAAFVPLIGNAGISYGLANKTPQGQPSVGFEVKILAPGADSTFDPDGFPGADFINEAKYASLNGLDAWDVNRYMNVWVVRITSGGQEGILGITTPPSFADGNFLPVNERGIVLTYGAFGKRRVGSDYYISGIDKGRTLTHELGHYFELRHIWGDDNNKCPTQPGYEDDGISDTPPQGDENFGCPSFPAVSCAGQPNGDMFMNYMDYVNDACMQMFTTGQVNLMRTQIQTGAPSYSLTQQVDAILGIGDRTTEAYGMKAYPNPAADKLYVSFTNGLTGKLSVSLFNTMGQEVYTSGEIVNSNAGIEIPVAALSRGVYYLHCKGAAGSTVRKIALQ